MLRRAVAIEQRPLPLDLFEADQHEVVAHHQRALHHHAVLGQQRVGVRVAHAGIQQGLYVALAVQHAAGVEETAQRQSAFRMPSGQLVGRRVVLHDVAVGVRHIVRVEPRLSLLASGALRIFDEQHVRHGFLLRVAAFVSRSSYQSGLKQPQSEANGRRMPRRRNVSSETFARFDPAGNGEGRPRRSRRARRSNVQMFHVKHRNRLRLQKGHRSRRLGLVY